MIILDGKRMGDREALHAELKEKLGLPSYYGGNLDALNDCLGERREKELEDTGSGAVADACPRGVRRTDGDSR